MSLLNVQPYSSSHHTCPYIVISKFFFFVIITLAAVYCYTTLVVLWDCYDLVCRFPSLCAVMKLRIKKIPHGLFMIPARTSLRSHAPAFMSLTCGISHSCEYAAHVRRTPRTSLRSHSPCHSHAGCCFFFVLKKDIGKFCSRDRVINAPCDSSAPRFLAARAELHFQSFLRFLLRVIFRQFFSLSTTLSSSPSSSTRRYHLIIKICCQYVMKSSKLVNTQKMVKNGCFWGSRKRGLKRVFLACFWPHRKITFFWHHHIINTSKNEALKKCLKKMSFWKKSKIF
jgi:hypothetical protein